jgi:opacity protein-like surface antigen
MRKSLLTLAFLGATLMSTAAFADTNVTGVIKSIDAKTHMLTLADGTTYMIPKTMKADKFKVGEKVTLSWDLKGTDRVIDTLKPAS